MKIIKEHWFRLGILVVLFLVGSSVLYYFVYFLPKLEQAKFVLEQEKETQTLISQCNNAGEKLYKNQYEVITTKSVTSSEYKFIKKDKKCYLTVSTDPIIPPKNLKDLFHYEYIVDVYENKMVLSDSWFETRTPE